MKAFEDSVAMTMTPTNQAPIPASTKQNAEMKRCLDNYTFETTMGFLREAMSDPEAPYSLINSSVKAAKELVKVFQYYQRKNLERTINCALENKPKD